jgi:hypothetical protein
MDGTMSLVGTLNFYGFAASMYYSYFAKPFYPLMWQSAQAEAIRHADAMQRGSWGEVVIKPGRK